MQQSAPLRAFSAFSGCGGFHQCFHPEPGANQVQWWGRLGRGALGGEMGVNLCVCIFAARSGVVHESCCLLCGRVSGSGVEGMGHIYTVAHGS